jgi:hypothetical protein
MPEAYWRVRPTPAIEHAVRQIALRENRTLANCLQRLLLEAIDARRLASLHSPDIKAAIAMIEGLSISRSKSPILPTQASPADASS